MVAYKFALIGNPVTHSLSPWIHQQFLKQINRQGSYDLCEVKKEADLSEQIDYFKKNNYLGFNVTVPYKETIIAYLDELDLQAKKIGAVNTVLIKDNRLIGYNTDGLGYVKSLEAHTQLKKDARILILGAGGAARGIYNGLKESAYLSVDIANRTLNKAEEIKETNPRGKTSVITLTEAEKKLNHYDLIIQTSSVGMKPNSTAQLISLKNVSQAIVSDIVYQPIETQFLKQAKEQGASVHYGHSMLLYQAEIAFNIWTGKKVSAAKLDNELKSKLEG